MSVTVLAPEPAITLVGSAPFSTGVGLLGDVLSVHRTRVAATRTTASARHTRRRLRGLPKWEDSETIMNGSIIG
jgi:hypothetical protein